MIFIPALRALFRMFPYARACQEINRNCAAGAPSKVGALFT